MSIYDELSLWPVKIRSRDGAWFTLWGSGGGEDDRLLVEGGRFLRFPTLTALRTHVEAAAARDPVLLRLRDAWAKPGLHLEPTMTWSIPAVERLIGTTPWRWSREEQGAVLDTLNLLWDIAGTLDRPDIRRALRGEAPLGRLAATLSFLSERAAPRALRAEAQADCATAFVSVLDALML